MSQSEIIPGEALIYEHANGVTYARYRDPPHNTKPRWVIGGAPNGFINGTNIPKDSIGLQDFENVIPNWAMLQNYPELQSKYIEYLQLQEKYLTWEALGGKR